MQEAFEDAPPEPPLRGADLIVAECKTFEILAGDTPIREALARI